MPYLRFKGFDEGNRTFALRYFSKMWVCQRCLKFVSAMVLTSVFSLHTSLLCLGNKIS